MTIKVALDYYLTRMNELGIIPNFWVSKPYLQASGAYCLNNEDWVWVEEDGLCLFPPLPMQENPNSNLPVEAFWSDFENWSLPDTMEVDQFLDFEYIYDPKNFFSLNGKKWSVFRKNIRKWPKSHDWSYNVNLPSKTHQKTVLLEWLEDKGDEAQDAELIFEYVTQKLPGVNKKFLYDEKGLAAINIWDKNYHYINYRFCLCRDDRFLDEFARWLFYTDGFHEQSNKLVNDGGILDREGLEWFKDKLNPVQKRKVYSWRKHDKKGS